MCSLASRCIMSICNFDVGVQELAGNKLIAYANFDQNNTAIVKTARL
jgi:hypothetical protein